jgi:hypothetical protein
MYSTKVEGAIQSFGNNVAHKFVLSPRARALEIAINLKKESRITKDYTCIIDLYNLNQRCGI